MARRVTVHASDLPAAVRKKHGLDGPKTGDPGSRSKRKKSRAGVGLSEPCPGRCVTCGERFPDALRWEQHAASTGCSVWSIDAYGEQQ